jgi:hypothetical protein
VEKLSTFAYTAASILMSGGQGVAWLRSMHACSIRREPDHFNSVAPRSLHATRRDQIRLTSDATGGMNSSAAAGSFLMLAMSAFFA